MTEKIPPAVLSVLNNDSGKLKKILHKNESIFEQNSEGFHAVDFAKLLRKNKCLHLLQPQNPRTFLFQDRGKKTLEVLSQEEIEERFQFSYWPWPCFPSYSVFKTVLREFPLSLRIPFISEEGRGAYSRYQEQIEGGKIAQVSIRYIGEEKGYGLFAEQELAPGEWVGLYAGRVRQFFRRHPDLNSYCFRYPTRLFSLRYFLIDSLFVGNELRFANHSDVPTMEPIACLHHHLMYLGFIAKKKVKKGEELTFDYGKDFWRTRTKN